MIRSFRHDGLKLLYTGRTSRWVNPQHLTRLRDILSMLDVASRPEDMALPGLSFHPLKGNRSGHFAVKVTGNWRVTFRFEDGDVHDVDYLDYH